MLCVYLLLLRNESMELGLLVQWQWCSLEFEICPFNLSLLCKDVDDELESFAWVEQLVTFDELTLIDHFHIKNVIYEADQQIDLGDNNHDCSLHFLINDRAKKTLETHQCGRKGCSELVRQCHLAQRK